MITFRPLHYPIILTIFSVVSMVVNADAKDAPTVTTTKITDSILFIAGEGGNLGVSIGEDGTFHLNNDTLEITHIADAHTDGDSVVHFKSANVLHTGDLFFNGFYPFIDTDHGGSLQGMLNASNTLLAMIDDETRIIPGHGPLATKKDLLVYRDMLKVAYDALSALKQEGKTIEQVLAANPLAALDAEWSDGLFETDQWISLIYNGLE